MNWYGFYSPSIVTMAVPVSLGISEIFSVIEWPDFEMCFGLFKVIENGAVLYTMYDLISISPPL